MVPSHWKSKVKIQLSEVSILVQLDLSTWSKRIMWGTVWFFLIGWLKITRVTHHCEIQMMTNIASEQLHEKINAIQMLCASYSDKKVQLLFFLSRLFKEAEGCARWVSWWRNSFQIQSWAGMSTHFLILFCYVHFSVVFCRKDATYGGCMIL